MLLVGNDGAGQEAWRGQVALLQLWDRALPEKEMKSLSSGEAADRAGEGLFAAYDFSNSPPYRDASNSLPALSWAQQNQKGIRSGHLDMDGKSWLTTGTPVENFNRAVLRSSQFTIHIVCTPAETKNANGIIVSVSRPDDNVNVHLRQDGRSLALWFRDPLSAQRANLPLYVPFAFNANQTVNITASYNGSDAIIYLDGERMPRSYRLTPGAPLAHQAGGHRQRPAHGRVHPVKDAAGDHGQPQAERAHRPPPNAQTEG